MIRSIIVVALTLGMASKSFSAQSVILSNEQSPLEVGQGFLTTYADQCHLVMPTHVAEEGGVNFRREGRQSAFGTVKAGQDLGDDISLFRVSGVSGTLCGISLSTMPRAVDASLQKAATVQLRFVNGDGTIGRMMVTVIDNDQNKYLRIKPQLDSERISKGLSGSLVTIEGVPIGMLLSVNARSGIGTVMRQDALLRKAEQFLRQSQPSSQETTTDSINEPSSLKLVGWDALPVHTIQPDTALADEGVPLWRFVYSDKPVSLDFKLLSADRVWSGIRIDVSNVIPEEQPDIVELLMSSSADSVVWRSVKTQRLEYVDDVAVITVAPRRAALLRLRLGLSMQDKEKEASVNDLFLSIRSVQALP